MGNKKGALRALFTTQFITAFADNAIFFTILSLLVKNGVQEPESQMAVIQAAFLLAYVVLAPFVGTFADKQPKSRVLLVGNIFKLAGTLLLFTGVTPFLCYGIVGIGAVIYSPAKYGILPDLTEGEHELHKANSKMEGFTILAILTGTVAGGFLGDLSVFVGLSACALFYLLSIAGTFFIPKKEGNQELVYLESAKNFFKETKMFFKNPTTAFSLVGTGTFWFASSVVRIAFLAWLADKLDVTSQSQQSMIVGVSAVGIVIGSFITPMLIPVSKFYRSLWFGIGMMLVIFASVFATNIPFVVVLLLTVGLFGGIFIVPMNTVLQKEGQQMVGNGKTIAIQNFVNNSFMLVGVLSYKALFSAGVDVSYLIVGVGAFMGIFLTYLYIQTKKLRGA